MSRPSILVVNVHKGASTFVADDFAENARRVIPGLQVLRLGSEIVRGATYADLPLPAHDGLIVRVYPRDYPEMLEPDAPPSPYADKRVVFMYRDPRDAAVSMYYSAAFSHTMAVPNPEKLQNLRSRLEAVDVREGVRQVLVPACREFRRIRRQAAAHEDGLECTYEQLVGDYPSWLEAFCRHVGWNATEQQQVYERTHQSLEPPTVVDPAQHKRRIVPGNWQEVFDDELRRRVEDELGDELEAAGYHW